MNKETNKTQESFFSKKVYVPPTITIEEIEMENGIAAGSATVVTVNANNQVQENFNDVPGETNDAPW